MTILCKTILHQMTILLLVGLHQMLLFAPHSGRSGCGSAAGAGASGGFAIKVFGGGGKAGGGGAMARFVLPWRGSVAWWRRIRSKSALWTSGTAVAIQ